jgi:diguanylate cyclase
VWRTLLAKARKGPDDQERRVDSTAEFEAIVRGPDAYRLARIALDMMVRHKVWPTPLNYELWLRCAGEPRSPLALEIERMAAAGAPFTDATCEVLAATHLPKSRLTDEIRDAGDQLSRELDTVSRAIQAAHRSSQAYGATLADATSELSEQNDTGSLKTIVSGLSGATRQVEEENRVLQKQLKESTNEVHQLRDHLAQVRRDATTDALTNLANRKAFDAELHHAHQAAARSGACMTLAVLDIDHFKRFNDTWGHQTGDQVLRYVGSVLGRVGAAPRFAARYGGEEFAIIFPGEKAAAVHGMLQDVIQEVASRTLRRRSTNEELGAITVSGGVAELKAGETAHALLERADAALYASKRGGRNRVTNAQAAKGVAAA